jgi:DNA (cytosine-5)-methyltransferase 1
MARNFQVVDLFAGPGGLAEGFSACRRPDGSRPFRIALSVEKEVSAHSTLRLRAFLRYFDDGFPPEYYDTLNAGKSLPDWSELYPDEWQAAEEEALRLELGTPSANSAIASRIAAIRRSAGDDTVLIGGPPCQAYSLVGRARNRGIDDYRAENDGRHFLYREYISVLRRLQPAAFVMENVKGILSSSIQGHLVFERILADLRNCGGKGNYILVPIAPSGDNELDLDDQARPKDFVVRAEQHGIPQARHRVIIVGLRRDLVGRHPKVGQLLKVDATSQSLTRHVLEGMPPLRSGLSDQQDDADAWSRTVLSAMKGVAEALSQQMGSKSDLAVRARRLLAEFKGRPADLQRASTRRAGMAADCPPALSSWLLDPRLKVTLNHEARGHMTTDLGRYFYCALFTSVRGRSPKSDEFPGQLAPDHANWKSGKFADRFRAQNLDAPSTTVTSHISKDGHYFIHPDPLQCRSLTVREAARLQTFPDNYLFLGNRTQQYVQVGNAVPPLLAHKIAVVLASVLGTGASAKQNGGRRVKAGVSGEPAC